MNPLQCVFLLHVFRLLFASRLASETPREVNAARRSSSDSNGSGSGTESDSSSDSGSSQNGSVAAETSEFDINDWHCEQQLSLVRSATLHDRAPLALGLLNALHAVFTVVLQMLQPSFIIAQCFVYIIISIRSAMQKFTAPLAFVARGIRAGLELEGGARRGLRASQTVRRSRAGRRAY